MVDEGREGGVLDDDVVQHSDSFKDVFKVFDVSVELLIHRVAHTPVHAGVGNGQGDDEEDEDKEETAEVKKDVFCQSPFHHSSSLLFLCLK